MVPTTFCTGKITTYTDIAFTLESWYSAMIIRVHHLHPTQKHQQWRYSLLLPTTFSTGKIATDTDNVFTLER